MEEPQEVPADEEHEQVWERVAAVDIAKASGVVCTCACRKPVPPGQMHRSSPSAWSRVWRRAAGVGRAGGAMIFGLWA